MKYFLSLLFLATYMFASAQSLNDDWKDAFENDDVTFIESNVADDNINSCYIVKGKPYNLLSIAIKLDAINIFKYLIDQKADLNLSCSSKNAILYAAKYGKLEMVKILVENGAKLKSEKTNKSALDYARKYQQVEVEKYLLRIEDK